MVIGIDFDNTIVCYDGIFFRVAVDESLVPRTVPPFKNEVRNFLRQAGKEDAWTKLQGIVYGLRLAEAKPYPGVLDFIRRSVEVGHQILIISHRTQYPYLGEKHDLHVAARAWVKNQCDGVETHFELTREDKITRIKRCCCDIFIDDLPEILTASDFPATTRPILFDPAGSWRQTWKGDLLSSWVDADKLLC